MEKILTIVVPTYNMENYLHHCLDSLIVPQEEMEKLEVLVINDGSKDSSSTIAHEYQDKYPDTFRVIDKENGNYGSCVNRGLKEAKGKYIKILDADDSFNKDALKKYIDKTQETDVDLILNDYVKIDIKCKVLSHSKLPFQADKTYAFSDLVRMMNNMEMHWVSYKTDQIRSIHYKQTDGIPYTDQEWIFEPMLTVKTFVYTGLPLYKYLLGREGQSMDTETKNKYIGQLCQMIFSLIKKYEAKGNNPNIYREYLESRLKNNIFYLYFENAFEKTVSSELCLFDHEIQHNHPAIEKLINQVTYCKLKFIKIWRKHHYQMPNYIRMIKKLRDNK